MKTKNVDNLIIEAAANGVIVRQRPEQEHMRTSMPETFVFTSKESLFAHIEQHFLEEEA